MLDFPSMPALLLLFTHHHCLLSAFMASYSLFSWIFFITFFTISYISTSYWLYFNSINLATCCSPPGVGVTLPFILVSPSFSPPLLFLSSSSSVSLCSMCVGYLSSSVLNYSGSPLPLMLLSCVGVSVLIETSLLFITYSTEDLGPWPNLFST